MRLDCTAAPGKESIIFFFLHEHTPTLRSVPTGGFDNDGGVAVQMTPDARRPAPGPGN
jgi:hypothetical protein